MNHIHVHVYALPALVIFTFPALMSFAVFDNVPANEVLLVCFAGGSDKNGRFGFHLASIKKSNSILAYTIISLTK